MIDHEPFDLPLVDPLDTARGRIDHRAGHLVHVEFEPEGSPARGVGEATPLRGWTELPERCREALDRASGAAAAIDSGTDADAVLETLLSGLPDDETPAARHGIVTAVLDAAARQSGRPLYRELGADRSVAELPVNATIGDGSPESCADRAVIAVADGVGCLKVKAGSGPVDRDVDRVLAVADAIGPAVALRIDANGAWSRDEARRFADAMESVDALEYLEQPLSPDDLGGHAALRNRVPIALDESVVQSGVGPIVDADAADAVVVKPMACGGVDRARSLALRAERSGIDPVISTTIDAVVARTAAVHCAASLPNGLERAHGLATADRLATDLAPDPAPVADGTITVPQSPGHGVRLPDSEGEP